MLTEYQAQKIRRDMEPELNASTASVIACLAGLATIVVLAAAAPETAPSTDASGSTVAAAKAVAPQPLKQPVPAEAARKTTDTRAQAAARSVDGTSSTDYPH